MKKDKTSTWKIILLLFLSAGDANLSLGKTKVQVQEEQKKARFKIPIDFTRKPYAETKEGKEYLKRNNGFNHRLEDSWGYPQPTTKFAIPKKTTSSPTPGKSSFIFDPNQFFHHLKNIPFIKTAHADPFPGDWDSAHPEIVNCRTSTSVSGYFKAYFEDFIANNGVSNNSGYADPVNGLARRTAVCKVLIEIAQMLKMDQLSPNSGQYIPIPDILFSAAVTPPGALAAASAYFDGLYSGAGGLNLSYNANSSKADNGTLYHHIVQRVNPTPEPNSFDAIVYTNWNMQFQFDNGTTINCSWFTDHNENPSNYFWFDLKTVLRHEIMHALGFMSRLQSYVDSNGYEISHNIFNENTFRSCMVNGICSSSLYSAACPNVACGERYFNSLFYKSMTPILQVPNGSPPTWFVNNEAVYQGRMNILNNSNPVAPDGIRPIFSPNQWKWGSSLSHFDKDRAGINYLMDFSLGSQETKQIHLHEKEVLCHMGYQVLGLCENPTPVANNDTGVLTGSSQCIDFLTNDISFSGGTLRLYKAEYSQANLTVMYRDQPCGVAANESIFIGANTKSIQITPGNTVNEVIIKYRIKDTPSGSILSRISDPAFIKYTKCPLNNLNEHICNGDFEMPLANVSNFTFEGGVSFGYVPFWSNIRSPDIFTHNTHPFFDTHPTKWFGLPNNYLNPNVTINMPTGSNFGAYIGTYNSINVDIPSQPEKIVTRFRKPLITGQCYKLSFDSVTTIEPGTQNNPVYTLLAGFSTQSISDFSTAQVNYLFNKNLSPQTTGPAIWNHNIHHFIASQNYEYLEIYVKVDNIGYALSASWIDNVSLLQVNQSNCNTVSGTIYFDSVVTNGTRDPSEIGVNNAQVGLFDSTGNLIDQTTASTSPLTLGNYQFSLPMGGINSIYYIALLPETGYSSITEPALNTSTLVPGYQWVRTINVTPGTSINGQNFGVLQSNEAPSPAPSPAHQLSAFVKYSCNPNDHSILLTVTGGTAPYTYLWSNGQNTQNITNLSPGIYSVTVTDINGGTSFLIVEVLNVAPVNISGTTTHASAPAFNNGSINITVTPTMTYSYQWTKTGSPWTSTVEDPQNLTPGSYTVTVTNSYKCKGTKTFNVFKKIKPVNPVVTDSLLKY